ncbi:MAG: STAS domain-containing protein [Candidatus Sedimenticola sp. (ex Thyasira tokunagai)]
MAEIILDADGCAQITGDIIFSTVTGLLKSGEASLVGRQALVFDLAGVTHSDSSALALLLELLDRGRVDGGTVTFRNIPDSLMGIARLSNVEQLLI